VKALRSEGFAGEVVVVGDEVHAPYDRPPLSKQVLAGTIAADGIGLGHNDLDATWRLGGGASGLRLAERHVVLADGTELPYDGLIVATGRSARPHDLAPLPGVLTLRSLDDAAALEVAARDARRVVIVGAGFIGCEVAATLRGREDPPTVTVVDVAPHPMPVMGEPAAIRAQALHESHGVTFRLGTSVTAVSGTGRVEEVTLADGSALPADLVLVAIGSAPNTTWLESSGLTLDRGCVLCDEQCFADGRDDVVAAGDVAAWPHPAAGGITAIEHWTNARDMARVAAANLLAGRSSSTAYAPIPSFWSDQYDVKVKSLGFLRQATAFDVVEEDTERRRLVVEASRDGELIGVILFNRNRALMEYTKRLRASAVAS